MLPLLKFFKNQGELQFLGEFPLTAYKTSAWGVARSRGIGEFPAKIRRSPLWFLKHSKSCRCLAWSGLAQGSAPYQPNSSLNSMPASTPCQPQLHSYKPQFHASPNLSSTLQPKPRVQARPQYSSWLQPKSLIKGSAQGSVSEGEGGGGNSPQKFWVPPGFWKSPKMGGGAFPPEISRWCDLRLLETGLTSAVCRKFSPAAGLAWLLTVTNPVLQKMLWWDTSKVVAGWERIFGCI